MIRRIKVCLNGGRAPGSHPALPVTPAQLAADAAASVAAGAEAIHLHPRGPDGRESLAADDVAAALRAVRAACPGVPVGVTTGLWISARRAELIAGWTELPDFASVNVGEDGYAGLRDHLRGRGVAVEAGVWAPDEAARIGDVDRILVEVIGGTADTAVPRADAILAALGEPAVPVLLHGEEDACRPLVAYAGRLGLPTRIGLEDTLDGAGNAALVREGVALWEGQRARR